MAKKDITDSLTFLGNAQITIMKKRILVAPLNWGIGHATRCIPIIHALIANGFEPVIASDGQALKLLSKEFEQLTFITLPAYNVKYSKSKQWFKWHMLLQLPKIRKAIRKEHALVDQIILNYDIQGIISDNRMGVNSKRVPSVFITHQLNVMSGSTTALSTFFHDRYLNKFDACWIPDFENTPNLSGKLGHDFKPKGLQLHYIGPLSRLEKEALKPKYDLMVLLSGPEPQRTLLEEQLLSDLINYKGKVVFVRGKIEAEQTVMHETPFTIYNFMQTEELQNAINRSQLIISRSGYTTIMDLAKLGKQAFFIPTPGQFEQEYLANYLDKNGTIASCSQSAFTLDQLDRVTNYSGFKGFENTIDFTHLFSLFQA
ncbi:glycosyltransferase [Olleya namhaensis]|uniref:glycosyltransferase n=1 Tax=Olleya namhaensis TaxID=1144750 RepID=UPI00249028D0|nr:glycosyltransferase [Olleya namhaensis]